MTSPNPLTRTADDEDMPERFECRGCNEEMSPNDYEIYDMCAPCCRERDECDAADAKRDDRD